MNDAAGPTCDLVESHGPMQAERIHTLDGQIDKNFGSYWFCQVPGCDGYGGPVEKVSRKMTAPAPAESLQLQLM